MKANELRIGNAVGSNLKDFPQNYFRMVEVSEHACVLTGGLDWHPLRGREYFEADDLEGIPLSEEWLLKSGFKLYDDNGELKAGDRFYTHPSFPGCLTTTFIYNWTDHRVQYVHQLQNLFWCLTGKELTLTPETK